MVSQRMTSVSFTSASAKVQVRGAQFQPHSPPDLESSWSVPNLKWPPQSLRASPHAVSVR